MPRTACTLGSGLVLFTTSQTMPTRSASCSTKPANVKPGAGFLTSPENATGIDPRIEATRKMPNPPSQPASGPQVATGIDPALSTPAGRSGRVGGGDDCPGGAIDIV